MLVFLFHVEVLRKCIESGFSEKVVAHSATHFRVRVNAMCAADASTMLMFNAKTRN